MLGLLFLLTVSSPVDAQDFKNIPNEGCEIVGTSGMVQVLFSGESEYVVAQEDIFLHPLDKLKTGSGSYAEVAFDDNGDSLVRIDSSTSVTFTLGRQEKINLASGEIFLTLENLPANSSFEVKTPAAVCGVAGTDWAIKADQENTDIETVNGNVYVKGFNSDGSFREKSFLRAGNFVNVKRFKAPSKPRVISANRSQKLKSLKNEFRPRAKNVISKRKNNPGNATKRERMKNSFEKRKNMNSGGQRAQNRAAGKPESANKVNSNKKTSINNPKQSIESIKKNKKGALNPNKGKIQSIKGSKNSRKTIMMEPPQKPTIGNKQDVRNTNLSKNRKTKRQPPVVRIK